MKRYFLYVLLLLSGLVSAQEEGSTPLFKFKPYGFIRNDFYYDSRQNLESANGLFYMIPKDKNLNIDGEDLNDYSTSGFLAIATRLGVNISGPQVWGANTLARIETDFAGFGSNTTMFRIRQAWVKFDWTKTSLLAGQTWHPMFGDVVPTVQSLATGSPFQPFNRSPQIRFDYKFSDSFRAYTSALYQLQYASPGPAGSSIDYQKNGILPEFYVGFDYKHNGWILGAGFDYLRIKPRSVAENDSSKFKVSEHIGSISANAFLQYTNDKWAFKAKTILGQNMGHLLLMSGYGVKSINDGSWEYTNFNNSTSWINITYGKLYQVGIFAGYSKNLGSDDEVVSEDKVYMMGFSNLDNVIRIAPQVSYNLKHWTFGVEYEMTQAAYGNLNTKTGKVSNTHNVANHRVVAVMMYLF